MPSMVEEYTRMKEEIPALQAEIEAYRSNVSDLEEKIIAQEQKISEIEQAHADAIAGLNVKMEEAVNAVEVASTEKMEAVNQLQELQAKLQLSAFENIVDGTVTVNDGASAGDNVAAVDHKKELAKLMDAGNSKAAIAYYREHKEEING